MSRWSGLLKDAPEGVFLALGPLSDAFQHPGRVYFGELNCPHIVMKFSPIGS